MASIINIALLLTAYFIWQSRASAWVKYPALGVIGFLVSVLGTIGNY